MTRVIEPTKGRVLVKLGVSEYGDIPVPPKDYDSITWGLIIKLNSEDEKQYSSWVGKYGHWKKYMDDLRIGEMAGKETLALIEISKIDGISWEE